MNIGIIGLGLMGGSLAKSIKARTHNNVFATDIDSETMLFARLSGAIDAELSDENISACNLIFLAVSPKAAIEWVKKNAEKIDKNTVVIDLCGVKRAVSDEILPIALENGFLYIGGHPMAGIERSGFVNSTPDLFVGASMILSPEEHVDIRVLEMLKALFIDVGFANVTFTTADEHDRIIAFTSQLAHVVSSAYVKSPEAQKQRGFSAGSFKDMTRLDEHLWTQLFLDNTDYIAQQLETLINNLNEYLDAIKENDAQTLEALLKDGREKKALAGGN